MNKVMMMVCLLSKDSTSHPRGISSAEEVAVSKYSERDLAQTNRAYKYMIDCMYEGEHAARVPSMFDTV
jgi:hypothetical protein